MIKFSVLNDISYPEIKYQIKMWPILWADTPKAPLCYLHSIDSNYPHKMVVQETAQTWPRGRQSLFNNLLIRKYARDLVKGRGKCGSRNMKYPIKTIWAKFIHSAKMFKLPLTKHTVSTESKTCQGAWNRYSPRLLLDSGKTISQPFKKVHTHWKN